MSKLSWCRVNCQKSVLKTSCTGVFKCLLKSIADSRVCATTATNGTSISHTSLACLSAMCNMTSSSWLQQCEHQSLSSVVLSGTGNQVFVNGHSDTFPTGFKSLKIDPIALTSQWLSGRWETNLKTWYALGNNCRNLLSSIHTLELLSYSLTGKTTSMVL